MITFSLFNQYKEIAHFCTDRKGGASMGNYASFNLSPYSGDQPNDYAGNQALLCHQLGITPEQLIIPYQTHGSEIREIDHSFIQLPNDEKSYALKGVDALFTRLPHVCIGVTTADCVPLLFYDPLQKVIAVAHAGWRGTCARIAEKTLHKLTDVYGSNPADVRVVIGPSISAEVYEVGKEVVENFEMAGFDLPEIIIQKNHSIHLDLWKANQQSLEKAGITGEHIQVSGICTYTEHERYFSARRLGIKSGRMLSGVMLIG